MSVSVPEKTLEHWSSLYISYRYRSKAALWWPAFGEDINVGGFPARPGKAVQLELKTTTVVRSGVHEVHVDLNQLLRYLRLPLAHQPFYAFPKPDAEWSGTLEAAADSAGLAVTELGFSRSGSGWWFADWMVVLTARQVAGVLRKELLNYRSGKAGKVKCLVQFDQDASEPVWGSDADDPRPVPWRDFWTVLESCGLADWPQLIRLPGRLVDRDTRHTYSLDDVRRLLLQSLDAPFTVEDDERELLVTLETDGEGHYYVARAAANVTRTAQDDADTGSSDHRITVFLDAQTLAV